MRPIVPTIVDLAAVRERPVLARVVEVNGSTPRSLGDAMLVVGTRIFGSVSGGCVDPSVFEHARDIETGGLLRLLRFGEVDDAFEVGLSCGGALELFLQRIDDPRPWIDLARSVEAELPVGIATVLEGEHAGLTSIVPAPLRTGIEGSEGNRVFLHAFPSRPRMFVFGATDFGAAVARQGRLRGYRVTVADARAAFATAERVPDADDVVVGWPDEVLAEAQMDASSVVLSRLRIQNAPCPAGSHLLNPSGVNEASSRSRAPS